MRYAVVVALLVLASCSPAPITKEKAAANVKAYEACATATKTDVQLANCAYAVGIMR